MPRAAFPGAGAAGGGGGDGECWGSVAGGERGGGGAGAGGGGVEGAGAQNCAALLGQSRPHSAPSASLEQLVSASARIAQVSRALRR